jgi:CxxC motif-containing protein (DUF1111 family)
MWSQQPTARRARAGPLGAAVWLAALGCQSAQDATSLSELAAGASAPGGGLTSPSGGADAFGQRAPNSSREHQLFFNSGLGFYQQAWLPAPSVIESRAGLGPLYNAAACTDCHLGGGRGRPPLDANEPFVGLVVRVGTGERGSAGEPEPDVV